MSEGKTSKGRVLSGMRPTGKLHLGNYVGALRNWVGLQNDYECFFFIADWHALTTDYADTRAIKQNSLEVILDYLAAGLDPGRSTLFIQSHVPQHAELHLLFSMVTPLGWLERVPSYKEQRENLKDRDLGTYGFLGYPLLQAADILIYQANFVPVGEDQVPHVELTREVARRFNQFYPLGKVSQEHTRTERLTPEQRQWLVEQGRPIEPDMAYTFFVEQPHPKYHKTFVFPEPQPLLTPAAKLPGTDGRKMSKSYGNTLLMSEPEPSLRQKLKTMVTDPARIRRTDPGDPDKCPVGDLHKIFSSQETMAKVYDGCRTAGIGCIECKSWATDSLWRVLEPMQERRHAYEANPKLAWDVLEAGSAKARKVAEATMVEAREAANLSHQYEPPAQSAESS
ncbi:MAG TPA: tryptophan--tRNA ligase [Candidatus Binatia bacterium]|nr:tryptophan--tRNA ligase [Candidatus Binatia bacterium]